MKPVRTIQARIQSDAPKWDPTNNAFYSSFGQTFEEGYNMALDSVNTASVEGALMYVQAEGINADEQSVKCERKNNMAYVVFYDVKFANTNETLAQYQEDGDTNEYGPMIAMDGGACTKEGDNFPQACLMMNGQDGLPNIGPFVGGTLKELDVRAPYPDNYWFSFANTCPTMKWKEKTPECRAQTRRGLCEVGQEPDGVNCIYSYSILGYIAIDDLVGITEGQRYKNFKEFCEAGEIEFSINYNKSLAFWENPGSKNANKNRTLTLIESYKALVGGQWEKNTQIDPKIVANMQTLPELSELAANNPKCYENAFKCSKIGCRRELYAQICRECVQGSKGCEVAPEGFIFPTLAKAKRNNDLEVESSNTSNIYSSGSDGSVATTTEGSKPGSKNLASSSTMPWSLAATAAAAVTMTLFN
jgi:hypothetical protein